MEEKVVKAPTCQGPLPWRAALTGPYSGSSRALIHHTAGGHRAAKPALYMLETTLKRSQNGSCFSKGSLVPSKGFPLCPRRGGWAVPGSGSGSSLSPHTGLQQCEMWVGRSRWRHKKGEEGKGEEIKGPLPLKCPTPARCGRGTACSRG